jgi:hypothetical protein
MDKHSRVLPAILGGVIAVVCFAIILALIDRLMPDLFLRFSDSRWAPLLTIFSSLLLSIAGLRRSFKARRHF